MACTLCLAVGRGRGSIGAWEPGPRPPLWQNLVAAVEITSTAPWLLQSGASRHKEPRSSSGLMKLAPRHLSHPPIPCHNGGALRQQGYPPPVIRAFISIATAMPPEAQVAQVRENKNMPISPSTGKQKKDLNSLNLRCTGRGTVHQVPPTAQATRVDLECVVLSEISQMEKDKKHDFIHMWSVKQVTDELTTKTKPETQITEWG